MAADGSGVLELAVAADEELTALLEQAGVDLLAGLEQVRAAAPGWEVERLDRDGGTELRLAARFDDPAGFEALVDGLHDGLGPEDGAIYRDLDLTAQPDGSVRFDGAAGLLLPDTAGAEGTGVSFDADDLAALLQERGGEFVRYDLRVTLPAEPVEHDADEVDGRSLVWHLPVGELAEVHARSAVPSDRSVVVAAAVALTAAVVAALVALWARRRRVRRGA